MPEPQFEKIDEVEYTCNMMPGRLANKTLVRLTALVGKPALVMVSGALEAEKAEDTEALLLRVTQIGIDQIFKRLTPDEAEEVLIALMSGVRFKGCSTTVDLSDGNTFDDHFRGALLRAYKVWVWSLGVNYRDFLDAARSNTMLSKVQAVGKGALATRMSTLLSQESAPQTKEST